ncbi:uncharacterized protein LOC117219300 [Megalopta genalis]|uniref:uncharacterized protein LOC117219300 n=1 Tax=Megalopta genalis TaxID=115081 RepID=UPI003FCF3CE6
MSQPECPGPCNPRNRRDHCRRVCLQHVATLLEELPPCIRARLRPEDVSDACGTLPKSTVPAYRDVSTGGEPSAKPSQPEHGKPIGDVGPVRVSEPIVNNSLKVATVQTGIPDEELDVGHHRGIIAGGQQQEAETQTVELGSMVIARRLDSLRSNIENVSLVLKGTASRLTGLLGLKKRVCSCRTVQAMLYSAVLLVLTAFARDTEFYQFFVSSQICGIIVVLSWKIAGSVPI